METTNGHKADSRNGARVVFITGSTGNIGAAVTARLLRADPTAELVLLVRAESGEVGLHRVEEVVQFLSPETDIAARCYRVTVVTGDITKPKLGLDDDAWSRIASRITEIIHSAAATKFLLPLPCARAINVDGTARVLELALAARRTGRLRQFVHVSTAYVCGDRAGLIHEDDFSQSAGFSNAYEQTKWEGEQLVRSHMEELPIAVVRPSIVVGDSHTGRTTAFNVLYTPLKMIYDGHLSLIPGLSDAQLDVVPLDYVADAITYIALHHNHSTGRTFNLTAGAGRTMSAHDIVARARECYRHYGLIGHVAKAAFVPPRLGKVVCNLAHGRLQRAWQLARPYIPYLSVRRQFVSENSEKVLRAAGIRPPALRDYLSTLLNFAIETDWGRRLRRPARAA
ncbi:MAG: SDR family oxidoreductase [Candidatus Zixiibacteriota bacterium]